MTFLFFLPELAVEFQEGDVKNQSQHRRYGHHPQILIDIYSEALAYSQDNKGYDHAYRYAAGRQEYILSNHHR